MTLPDWTALSEVADALCRTREVKLAKIMVEEQKLRQTLKALNSKACFQRSEQVDMRRIGGDVLWHSWISQRRAALQMQLAQILAKKGDALLQLQQAHGKSSAISDLVAEEQHRQRSQKQRQADEQIAALGLLARDL